MILLVFVACGDNLAYEPPIPLPPAPHIASAGGPVLVAPEIVPIFFTNDDLQALIGAAEGFPGPGFLVPMRNPELLRWCLAHGLRPVLVLNLMTIGLYSEPRGAFLASVWY